MRCSVCRNKLVAIQIEYIAPKKNKKSLVVATALVAQQCHCALHVLATADALDLGL